MIGTGIRVEICDVHNGDEERFVGLRGTCEERTQTNRGAWWVKLDNPPLNPQQLATEAPVRPDYFWAYDDELRKISPLMELAETSE